MTTEKNSPSSKSNVSLYTQILSDMFLHDNIYLIDRIRESISKKNIDETKYLTVELFGRYPEYLPNFSELSKKVRDLYFKSHIHRVIHHLELRLQFCDLLYPFNSQDVSIETELSKDEQLLSIGITKTYKELSEFMGISAVESMLSKAVKTKKIDSKTTESKEAKYHRLKAYFDNIGIGFVVPEYYKVNNKKSDPKSFASGFVWDWAYSLQILLPEQNNNFEKELGFTFPQYVKHEEKAHEEKAPELIDEKNTVRNNPDDIGETIAKAKGNSIKHTV